MPQVAYRTANLVRKWIPGVYQLVSILAFSILVGCGPREIVVSFLPEITHDQVVEINKEINSTILEEPALAVTNIYLIGISATMSFNQAADFYRKRPEVRSAQAPMDIYLLGK